MKKRVFIAIILPSNLKEKISKKIIELNKDHLPITWVSRENFHLTLKFLGYLNEGELVQVGERLHNIFTDRHKKFSLKIENLEIFPKERPKIIGFKIKNSKTLDEIVENISRQFNNFNFIKKDRLKFKPHLTIGRIKERVNNWPKDLEKIKIDDNFVVDTIDLMESQLDYTGPQYSIIKSYYLKKI